MGKIGGGSGLMSAVVGSRRMTYTNTESQEEDSFD